MQGYREESDSSEHLSALIRQGIQKLFGILLLLIFMLPMALRGQQTLEWVAAGGSTGHDFVTGLVPVKNGMIAAGTCGGDFRLGSRTAKGFGDRDIFITRLDQKGQPDWLHLLGGAEEDVAGCIAGGEDHFFVGGTIYGTVYVDQDEFRGEGPGVFISCWDQKGGLSWFRRLSYTGHATFDVIQPFPDGSLMVGGMLQGILETGDGSLSSPDRKLAWHVWLSPGGEPRESALSSGPGIHRLKDSALDDQGNQYLLYSTRGGMSFQGGNPVPVERGTKSAVILAKLDESGNFLWGKSFCSTGFCETYGLAVDMHGGVKVSVNFNRELTALDTLIRCDPQLKGVLLSLDKDGQKEWIKTISSPINARVLDVLVTPQGKTLITGLFRHRIKTEELEFSSNNAVGDLYLLQYNEKGELEWSDFPAEDAANYCNAFALGEDGNLLLGGSFRNSLTFRSGKLESLGGKDLFLAKYFNCEQLELALSNTGPLCDGESRFLSATAGFESYIWNGDEWGGPDYEIHQPGSYTVTAYTRQGCPVADTVTIDAAGLADLGLTRQLELSPGDVYTLRACEGYTAYRWSDGQEGPEREVAYRASTADHLIWLTAQTSYGCEVRDSVYLHYQKPEAGLAGLAKNDGLKLYPNPVSTQLYWSSGIPAENLEVVLSDSKGNTLYREKLTGYRRGEEHLLDMSGYAPGAYTFSLQLKTVSFSEKVIKTD